MGRLEPFYGWYKRVGKQFGEPKTETMNEEEKVLYKYLDIIIKESSLVEENNSRNILNEKYLDSSTEHDEFFRITLGIVKLGFELGFLKYKYNQDEGWFDLTEKGIKVKEKGGYFKYLKFMEKKELEKVKPTIIAEKYIGGDNYENISSKNLNINSNNPTTNNEMANTKKESQTNSIKLKFWKLISENKLVSSFVLVVILWAIKEIFDIDLKI